MILNSETAHDISCLPGDLQRQAPESQKINVLPGQNNDFPDLTMQSFDQTAQWDNLLSLAVLVQLNDYFFCNKLVHYQQ